MFDELLSRHGLSLDRLRNFAAVVDVGSITRVADGDPARQSLISRQIRELEEFFGVQLTRRKGKGLEPTPAGVELARHPPSCLRWPKWHWGDAQRAPTCHGSQNTAGTSAWHGTSAPWK